MRSSEKLLVLASAAVLVRCHVDGTVGGPGAGGLVDDKALQDAITVENLLGRAQDLEDIAYATKGRNRVVDSEGHNNTVRYLVEQLEALGGYYNVELDPFQYVLRGGQANFSARGVPLPTGSFQYSKEISLRGVPVVPVANLGCAPGDFSAKVAGSIALISRGECTFSDKSYFAAQAGAKAAVIYNNVEGLYSSGTLGGPNASLVATAAVSRADGLALVASSGNTTLLGDLDAASINTTIFSHNVIATTAHTNSSDILFLGAHSDSVRAGPGINDNGSGLVGILEVAIQLARGRWRTVPNIRFGWWTAEEEGLLGSRSYVARAPARELSRVRLYLNFDMIASPNYRLGVYDGDGSAFGRPGPAGSGLAEAVFERWLDGAGQNRTASELSGRSDYAPFLDAGIPCGGLDAGADDIKTEEDVAKFGGTVGAPADPNYHTAADNVTNLSPEAFVILSKGIAHAVAFYGGQGFADFPGRNSTAGLGARQLGFGHEPSVTGSHPWRRGSRAYQ